MLRFPFIVPCLLLLASCSSFTTLHTARPVPVNETEITVALSSIAFEDDDGDTAVLPFGTEYMLRHGLAEGMDAGIKLSNFSTLQGDLNFALYEGEDLVISVDPTVSYTRIGSSFTDSESSALELTYVWLPLLVDVFSNDAMTLTLAGRVGHVDVQGDGSLADVGLAASGTVYGAGAGARFHVSDSLDLLTEFNVIFPADDVADEPLYMLSIGASF